MFNRIVKFFKDYIEKLRICIALPDYIYYINGSETLPPPLSQDEEKVVFAGLEEGRQSCKDILIVHNLRLVVYIAKKFESSGIPIEDIIS
ncbi:MAG: sporulation sigma factor SigE, partial [Oscillospiraceae bacterium]